MSTLREEDVFEKLKKNFGNHIKAVSFSYIEKLGLINNYLTLLYGELADWNRNLGLYLNSPERQQLSYIINDVKDLLEIPTETIYATIKFEEQNTDIAKMACKSYKEYAGASVSGQSGDIGKLILAAQILGVFPVLPDDVKNIPGLLNEYYVVFQYITDEKKKAIRERILSSPESIGILSMAVSLMVDTYEEGNLATYPFVGTMVTQPRGRNFWRGENAYYGKSQASIYRTKEYNELTTALFEAVKKLRYDECGFMFDKFDACRMWDSKIANVNWMAIMQHYGLPTDMMDVTSDFKTALFFACCKWQNDGSFSRWVPLEKEDFENSDSRKSAKDSRYGVIYKARAEIEDLMWLVVNAPKVEGKLTEGDKEYLKAWKHIVPVGFQPFQRCKAQNAYMLLNDGDLMGDTQFDKVQFRLNEDICQWIYNEMDQGKSIYPELNGGKGKRIPDISQYVSKIAGARVFSRSVFDGYCKLKKMNETQRKSLEKDLLEAGFIISLGEIEFISKDELDKINREYGFDEAVKMAGMEIKSRPVMVLG